MTKSKKNNKVILGLSGGVDSTAAALLLQEKGYEVTGLYFDIHPEGSQPQPGSDAVSARERAFRAAEQLGIDFIYKNVADAFEKNVISDFCREYACGRTPNPCVVCNPSVKFAALLEAADETGAYYIATGHYADTYYHIGTIPHKICLPASGRAHGRSEGGVPGSCKSPAPVR